MKLSELIRISNRNLFRAKMRTLLTVLAIFVGSFTLVLTNGLGGGLRNYVEKQVKNIEGKGVLFVRKKPPAEDEEKARGDAPREYKESKVDEEGNTVDPNSFSISLGQIESVKRELPEVTSITP